MWEQTFPPSDVPHPKLLPWRRGMHAKHSYGSCGSHSYFYTISEPWIYFVWIKIYCISRGCLHFSRLCGNVSANSISGEMSPVTKLEGEISDGKCPGGMSYRPTRKYTSSPIFFSSRCIHYTSAVLLGRDGDSVLSESLYMSAVKYADLCLSAAHPAGTLLKLNLAHCRCIKNASSV